MLEVMTRKFSTIQAHHADPHAPVLIVWLMQGELQADVLKVMTKKFSTSAKVWLAAIQGCVRQKDVPAAQAWLERSTKALPQRKHVKVTANYRELLYISIHSRGLAQAWLACPNSFQAVTEQALCGVCPNRSYESRTLPPSDASALPALPAPCPQATGKQHP